MTKRKTREKRWRVVLFLLILSEVAIIGGLAYQVYMDSLFFPIYQLTGFLFLSVWIYIAYLKQRTVDVSEYALGEKFKTHALIESIPLGAVILDQGNEILIANAMASSLLGKEIMLIEDRDLGHCLPYDVMKNIYGNQWGGYVTRGLEGVLDVTLSVTPIKDQSRQTIGKLLIIQGANILPDSKSQRDVCSEMAGLCLQYIADTEAVLRPAKPETARGTRIRSLLTRNIIEREKALQNLGKATDTFGTLNDVLISVITDVKSAYASKKLSITTDLHDSMLVKSPETFLQVIREIMINALLYSEEGSSVSISSKSGDDYFEICIKDSGIGMDEEILSMAFEENFVGSNYEDFKKYRQGRGLYTVKTLLEEVGVSVRVESKKGVGTLLVMSGQQSDIE